MRASLFAGALLLGALAGAIQDRQESQGGRASATVVRAHAPFAVGGDRHGELSFHGVCWRVGAGWSSDKGRRRVDVAVALARTCT